MKRAALVALFSLLAAGGARAQHLAAADLQIQGSGLRVITVSATTGIDIPASIQTEFGGRQNDEAANVEGLIAAGELDGPGIDVPIRLETAPGHKFTIPALSREGIYFLRNIRLMKGSEFLQSATPSIATITVSNLLQTAVKVRQLSAEELRARGITIDARNFEVFEYTFSFFIDGKIVEIPYPVIIDKRTREVRPLPKPQEFILPPISNVVPPRWSPPGIYSFGLGGEIVNMPENAPAPGGGGGPGRPSIPAALVIPNNLAVLHQFFAVTLMVTNGAPEGSTVTLDGVTAMIRTPTELRVVKSVPASGFNLPVPVVDATTGVRFLVAQAKGDVDWTIEGLKPGTHTLEVEVRATYKSPGQADFPLKGNVRASIVVHDPRFNITFSHPDTVRKGIDYTTYSFVTNMSPVAQTIRVNSGVQSCAQSPLANICRTGNEPEFVELTIPAGQMRMIEYKLRPSVTGSVFANAGSVDGNVSAAVQLHMGVSETGIPLSPATLVLPYYAQYVDPDLVGANLQLLGLGYSIATAPLTQALASHPQVIKTDVFLRAVDIARAGQHIYLGEETRDAVTHMALDLLGNGVELREWDDLRRRERSGRTAGASVVRELEKGATDLPAFVDRFAEKTAHRTGYALALLHGPSVPGNDRPYALSARGVTTNRKLEIPNEAGSGWIRDLPFADLSKLTSADGSRTGELAIVGRWTEQLQFTLVPSVSGPHSLDLIYPAATDGTLLRAHVDLDGPAGRTVTVTVNRGDQSVSVRDGLGAIVGVGTVTSIDPEPLRLIGARQDLHLDEHAHTVSVLFNRPAAIADGDDWLTKFHGQVILNKDGVNYTGPRPISAAALQESGRVVNLTFDHALSQNASYSLAVDPVKDPLGGASVSFPQPLTIVIDNDAPGGIVYGHVLAADNTPIADAEVVLTPIDRASQYDTSRAGDGSFLFEWVQRDVDLQITGAYSLRAVTTDAKVASLQGSVRLPGRVHFVNLVFLGRGSAEGYVRYDDGTPVAEARVVIGSTLFDQFQSATTDANGFYRATDLPVGPLTFSATDEDGNVTYLASEIKTPGQVLKKDLSIYRRPFPGLGVIRGLVKRSDTDAPVAGAHVGVFSQGYGLIDGYTDENGRFEFAKVPTGFVTVLASEWTVSRESVALDFDLGPDERRDVVLTLNVAASEPLVTVEGDVIRENPLFPGDTNKYEKVAGALVKIEHGQTVTADGNGRYVIPSVPISASGDSITAYDPLTTRSSTISLPALNPAAVNNVPIFIGAKSGGEGTVRVRVLNAGGAPALGLRVIEPGFPPQGPQVFTDSGNGVYTLEHVPVGKTVNVWAISTGGVYGDQSAHGNAKVEFNGHIAPLTLRLGGQGTVRVKLKADIDIIGDVSLTYEVFDEALQEKGSKTVTVSTAVNGQPDYAVFTKVPAATQDFAVASVHPVYGSAGQSGKLGFDGDLASITLQLNKLSTVRGTVYAIDGRTPIPGAAVRLVDGRQDQGIYTTLQDGSFVFSNLPASTGFRVVAEITQAGVYRTGQASGSTPALGGPVDNIALVMGTQGSIDGRVVYAAYKVFDPQNPANNVADDTPNDLSDNAPVPLARFYLKELGFPQRVFGTSIEPLGADLLGRFSFNNIFTGPLHVTASDPGNQEIRGAWTGTLTQEGERLTAYVGIGDTGFGSVSVSVVDPNAANAPVVNAEVSLYRGGNIFDFATTDAAGRVQFEQLSPGSYSVSAYSKAVGKSGTSGLLTVSADTDTSVRVDLEFSSGVTGSLIDPEDGDRGIPGAHVSLQAFHYDTRTTTGILGDFLFEGVREGLFTLTAKDTLTNRRASASRLLTQADPRPNITLELEPTETLHIAVYEPNDTGGISNVLVPLIEATVIQRCAEFVGCDYTRAAQGNPLQFEGALEQAPYSVELKEIGGQHRELRTTASFPTGTAANPLKLVFPAYGNVEVRVTQANAPVDNARVTVAGGGTSATLYTDNTGVALATGIALGNISVQASTLDGAFSGSATATLSSQSTKTVVTISLGAFAGVTGYVEAETGGPSNNTRVVASWPGRTLEMFTDSTGRYVFQGITTGTTVDLVYVGPDDITIGARQSYAVKTTDASQTVTLPSVRLDATPPQLVSFTPADGSLNVSPDTSLEFVFSEKLQPQYVNNGFIQLVPADSFTPVNGTYTSFTQADGKFVVRMTPPAGTPFPLASNTLYRIIVSGEVRDLTGNRMPGSRGGVFTTTDYAQPSVVKVTPSVTTPLSSATIFQFQFNEPIEGDIQFHLYKISAPGAAGAIVREVPGRAFFDPESSLVLVFSPDEPMEPQSFYRTVFSGIRDRQGNAADTQTFHFFSFDSIRPFVILNSPLPDGFPLISGVEYTLTADIRDTDANGPPATDIARVDYLRVDGASTTFLKSETKTPFSYRFVAPDVPEGGAPFTLRAEALDLSGNTSEPASRTWTVQPNKAPQNVAVSLTPNTTSYAGNRIIASVAFDDEGILATVQAVLTATQADGTPYTKSLVKQATRASVAVPWTAAAFDFDLPPTLKESTVATFTATVTDARGQATPATASLTILEDLVKPALVSLTPPAETRYSIGNQYTIEAVVQDLESGVQRVVFTFDGQTVTILGTDASVTPGAQPRTWRFATPQITVPAKNVDTRIPIIASVYDYHGNVFTHTVEIVYVGVNDPTIPRGAWLCPVDRGTLPANQASLSLNLQVRATDDISVTGVKFTVPGNATPLTASRVGITDVWQATANVATPAAGTPFSLTAVISDASTAHDVTLPIPITLVDADVVIDDRIQAVTAADVASYENKTIVVRGAAARLVPHVPLTLKNLIVLQGGKVESLSTTTTTEQKLDLTITENLYVDCASAIDVTGRGYLGGWALNPDGSGTRNNDMRGRTIGNTADGGPSSFSAASHGGVGGESASGVTNAVYGSITNPANLGTGGGGGANCCNAGGSGGGAVKLQGGVFAIAGAIRADGSPLLGDGNPGSGGSINLNVRQLITGPSARITANGGDDDAVDNASRGAGGGRIAVIASERFDVEKLGIQLAARGGRNATSAEAPTYLDGGAGTVYLKRPGQPLGELFIGNYDDRFPATLHLGRHTPISDPSGTLRFDRVEAGQRALVRADSSIDVGGAIDTRAALIIENSAAVLFPNDKPFLSVTTTPPAESSLVQGATLSATYTTTSLAGIGSATIQWTPVTANRVDSYFAYPTTPTPSTVALTIPTGTATGGTTLTVTTTDRAGRTTSSAPLAFTIIANAPPAITELVAAPAAVYPGKSITATVSATDDLQVTKLTFTSTINNGTPSTQTKTPNSATVTDTFTVAVPITTPGGAPFTLDVAVEDAFPGRTATTQSLNVTILTDTVAPALNVTSPASGAIYQEGTGALIQVRATAVDAEVGVKQVYAQFDGGTQYPLTAGPNGSYSADIPVPNVDGIDVVTKQLVVTAKDYENNAAVATAIPIQIRPLNDPNAPVVQWTCASNGALLPAGVAAKLRVYAIGNDVGNAANGVQKVELFIGEATTPIVASAVSGLPNHYEATYTVPAGTADGTELAIRALVTNTAGLQSDMTTRATVVTGTVLTANTNISAGDTTYDGQTVIVQSGTLTIAGQHAFARLIVLGGAKVTHLATDATTIQRLTFNADAVYVACDGSLDASGRGFAGAASGSGRTWPNATTSGSYNGAGGSHGGRGGAHDQNGDSAPAYGSLLDPNEPGGAGGLWFQGTCAACGAGGGVIRVVATTFVVDGNVLANGINDTGSGPGAGGSIRIDAGTLSGSGEIRADAGPAGHTGGGGGRIAVYAQSLTLDRTKITAAGSLYTNNLTRTGAAGTVYIETSGADELIADNLDRPALRPTTLATAGTGTVVSVSGDVLTLSAPVAEGIEGSRIAIGGTSYAITARTATTVTVPGATGITAGAAYQGLWRFDQVTARRQGTVETAGLETPLIITTSTGLVRADVLREEDIALRGRVEAGSVTATSLALQNGATLGHAATTSTKINKLTVDVETLTVDATSSIDVTGRGLTGVVNGFARTGSNVTTGGSVNGAGGSHGGRGGAHDAAGESAATYGSLFDPDTPGGAGANANAANCDPCGTGGGVARIKASTFVLDGKLLANGINTGSGGGAGGSVRIDAGSLSGAGEIRAEGGPTTHTAGGGGRIALYYRILTFDRAKITAAGGLHTGNATRTGGAGTVYFRRVDASGNKLDDELVLDNRDRVGTHLTPVESASFDLVTIRGAAIASADTIATPLLTSTSNAYIELSSFSRDAFTLRGWVRVNGNVDVPALALEAGAKLEVDGLVKSTTLTLTNGAVLSQAPTTSTKIARLTVDATTINVDAASAIDVSGKGFVGTVSGNGRTWPNTATGGSVNGSGGSHGGRGGAHDQHGDSAQAYGSVFDPNTPGGAGGQWFQDTCATCNAGGGIARIQAATFVLDGKVLANGTNSGQSGAGAGGSIRIDAQSLTGTGEIHADSGPAYHTGGGGGRIAIYVPALGIDKAKITAAGGLYTNSLTRTGAAGTVYIQTTGANELLVDNVDRPSAKETTLPSLGTGTIVSASGSTIGLSNAAPEWIEGSFIDIGGTVYPVTGRTSANVITVQGTPPVGIGTPYRGLWRFDGVTVKRQSVLSTDVLSASLVETTASSLVHPNELRGDDLVLRGRVETNTVTARSLALQNSAFLTHPVTTTSQVYRLTLNVQQAFTVDATSTIDVSSRGYTGSTNGYGTTWPNTTTNGSYNGAGGSHGGRGGQHDTYGDSAPTYGSLFDPTLPGAAGGQYSVATCNPCNPGGGVVRITAGSVAVDGKILANGAGAGSGGGAGGSIRIDTGTLSGAGDIRAEGGATGHVAGGGGRIAVYYENLTFNAAKILAPGGLYTNNPTRTGAAGTVYLKQTAQQYGDLIVDNAGRNSAKNTVLPSIGFRTVTHTGPSFVRDSSASFPAPDFLARMRLVINHNKSVTWPIVTNDATTVNVDTTSAPLTAQVGNSFRGLYRFDNTKLRSSRLEVHDLFESGTAIDKDAPSALLGSNLAPVLTPSLITLQSTPTNSSIVGAAGAALDPDAPLVLTATNLGTGNTFVVNANVDGSFVIPLQGNQGDRITLRGKDSNFFPLETPLLDLGTMQFGTPPPGFLDKTEWTSDTNFRARIVVADDRNILVAGGSSDKVTILSSADPARPSLVRTVTLSDGVVNDLAIVNGWALIAANDIMLLDLNSTTSTPIYLPDYGNTETSIAVADGFAFVATPHFTDGRIRIYDVSTPSNTRYVREQAMVPSINFTSVLAYGDQYLIAITPTRPGGLGHDVVVIDRSNMYGLVKVADFDVPNFDAYYGAINGTRLHLTSPGSAEVVVVELANPAAPAVAGRTTMSANGGRPAMIDDSVFVAASTAGLVEVDASNPAAPGVIGVSPTTGTAYDVELRTPWAYVASDLGLSVIAIATPPQIDASRITMGVASQIVTVTGTAGSIRGSAPIGVVIENVSSGTTGTGSVAANGTFTASVGGLPGDVITLTATDSAARTAGPVLLGRVPLGSGVINTIFPPSLTGEAHYRARTVASAGNHLIVGGAFDGNSTRLLVFDVTNPAVPVYKRTVALSDGAINQVAIQDHWAIIVANDVVLLDLDNPASAPIYVPDYGNVEYDITFSDGYAFTATPHFTDGRIRVYDISSLPTVRYVREQPTVPSVNFTGIAALGSRYLVGMTENRPGGVGHDVVVIDRGNLHNMVKVADLDIPNFGAYRGELVGNTLYLAGTTGGMAIVDLTNPLAPVVKSMVPLAAARGIEAVGNTVFVGNGSAGVTLVDTADPAAPSIFGTLKLPGTAWGAAFNRGNLYVATEQGLSVIQNIATAPMVEPSRLSVTPTSATLATVSGTANSVYGLGPLTVAVKNVITGSTISGRAVASNGSFSVLIPAALSESLVVEATDAIGRKSGWVPAGSVPFGTAVDTYLIDGTVTGQSYTARTLATDGRWLLVGGYADGNSTKLLVYDVADPALPQLQRVVALSDGAINNVAIHDGWAVVAANDIVLLDLSTPSSSPLYIPDYGNIELDLAISGGYAFTATPHFTDSRIRIYDVSRPSSTRYVREQVMGIPSLNFNGLIPVGTNYLVATSDARPGGVGHDVVVIDRTNVYNLVKVFDLDIPNFDAFRGKVVGNTLYVAGRGGGLAILDVTDPRTPVLLKVMATAGSTNGVDGYGSLLAVADGGSGVSFLDITTPATAQLFGTQRIGGNAYNVAFNRGHLYAVNEQALIVIRDFGAAPNVAPSLVTITFDGIDTATVTGAAHAISGAGTLTFEARNARTGASAQGTAALNGSFSASVAAQPGDLLTVEATDEAGRKSGRVHVGMVPFGTITAVPITPAMSEANFRPRMLVTDGKYLIVGSYGDGSSRIVIFDVSNPAVPQFLRNINLSDGVVNAVAIHNGWAIVAANDIVTLDLSNPTAAPVYVPDFGNTETTLAVSGGYAFTTTPHFSDGRFRVYDVSNPAAPRYIREQILGVNAVNLTAIGSDYLVATSSGHDVVVIDRRNVYALAKVADIDIPAFDGFRGKASGTTLYLGGSTGGLAIVDLSNPASPVVKQVYQTPGDPLASDVNGSMFAVADAAAGVTFLDVSNPFAPQHIGTQATGGTVWATAFNRGALYAANEQGLIVLTNVVPMFDRSLITIAPDTITGAARSVAGIAPLTVNLRNARTNASTGTVSVAANGSFTATLISAPTDPLEITVTDAVGRTNTLSLGNAAFGTVTTQLAGPPQAANDTNYRARRIASDGANTIVTSGSTYGLSIPTSGRAIVFRSGSVQNYQVSNAINDVAISGGYAYIAANDFAALNLSNPNATAFVAADAGNTELSVAILNGYAYTATPAGNDARIRIYNLANPAQPVFYREQSMALGALTFTKVLAFAPNYLVGIADGHDAVLIDASNPAVLVKLADLDIPNFTAIDGAVEGTTLYLAGGDAGIAVVDFTGTPAAPAFTTAIIDTPGIARGVTVSGTRELAVADGSSGVTFIDATTRTAPVLLGTHVLSASNVVGVTAVGRTVYAAADNQFHTITRFNP